MAKTKAKMDSERAAEIKRQWIINVRKERDERIKAQEIVKKIIL